MTPIRRYIIEVWDKYRVYVDLDGVLTDFVKDYRTVTGKHPKDMDKFWEPIQGNEKFWSEMSWMPDGKKFWLFLKTFLPTILS